MACKSSQQCSLSDLVGFDFTLSFSSLCVRRRGLLYILLLSGKKVHGDPLYRLMPRTGPPWMRLGCTGPPWFSWDDPQKRYDGARWSTCAGLWFSCLTSYRRAEEPKMVSTSSSRCWGGLRPRIRGWSTISLRPAYPWSVCRGRGTYPRGEGGGLGPWWFEGGEGVLTNPSNHPFLRRGQKMQIVPIHHWHAKNRIPWIPLHCVSGPWTSIVAALDGGRSNIAVCRRYIDKEFLIKMEGNTGEFSDISGSEIHWGRCVQCIS